MSSVKIVSPVIDGKLSITTSIQRTSGTWVDNALIVSGSSLTKIGTDAINMDGYSHITIFGFTNNGTAPDNIHVLVCNTASTTATDFVKDTTKTPMLTQSLIDNTRFDFCLTYEHIGAPFVGLFKQNTSGSNENLTVFYALTN